MKKRTPYIVNPRGKLTVFSAVLMLLSVIIRLSYYVPQKLSTWDQILYIAIPSVSCALFALFVLGFGGKTLLPTLIGVIGGVVFFIVKAWYFPSIIHTVLCWLLYLGVLVIYSLSVTGVIPTKALLFPLFGLPFAYHVAVEDMGVYYGEGIRFSFIKFMPELSVLLIMLSLFILAIAMKKKKPAVKENEAET